MDLIRIVFADDHPVVLSGFSMLVSCRRNMRIVATASSSPELMKVLENNTCDVLVCDLKMPEGGAPDGLAMLEQLHGRWPNLPILVVTTISSRPFLRTALSLGGVRGLLSKQDALTDLIRAIEDVACGKCALGNSVQPAMSGAGGVKPDSHSLSVREAEVIRLLCSGMTLSQIARRLERSNQTVSAHKTVAMKKLGLSSNYDLHRYAVTSGLM